MATRLESHLSRSVLGLHDSQFGFRRGRSTADAVARVRSLVDGAERRVYVALAVSLDVVNAFNSIPWDRIRQALKFHWAPAYLRGVVRAFLWDRSIGVEPVGDDVEGRARRALLDRWRVSLDMRTGAPWLRVLETVLPNWDVWLDGAGPLLTYRVTQVLTGHGCFGEYLHRIRKEATSRCHHAMRVWIRRSTR